MIDEIVQNQKAKLLFGPALSCEFLDVFLELDLLLFEPLDDVFERVEEGFVVFGLDFVHYALGGEWGRVLVPFWLVFGSMRAGWC